MSNIDSKEDLKEDLIKHNDFEDQEKLNNRNDTKESKILVNQQTSKNQENKQEQHIENENENERDSSLKYKHIVNQQNQNYQQIIHKPSVNIKDYNENLLDTNSLLYAFQGNEDLAESYSKEHYLKEGNELDVYNQKRFFANLRKSTLFPYGIDLSNLFFVIKMYFYMFFIIYILKIIFIFSNFIFNESFYKPAFNKNPDYYLSGDDLMRLIHFAISFIIMLVFFIILVNMLYKMSKKYYRRVASQFYSDESIYSIFIKNLPLDTNADDLESYLKENFKVGEIKSIILLKDIRQIYELHQEYMSLMLERNNFMHGSGTCFTSNNRMNKITKYNEKLNILKKKLIRKIRLAYNVDFELKEKHVYDDNKQIFDSENNNNNNNNNKIIETESDVENSNNSTFFSDTNSLLSLGVRKTKQIEFSRCAIVTFERNEDKNQFLRGLVNIKQFMSMLYEKPYIFRGKRVFIENVPQMNLINFPNTCYSTEKQYYNSNTKFLFYFFLFYISNLGFTLLKFLIVLNVFNDIPLLKTFLLYIANFIVNFLITLTICSLNLTDKYLENVLIQFAQMQRSFSVSLYANIITFLTSINEESDHKSKVHDSNPYFRFLEYMLITGLIKLISIRYNKEFQFRRVKFLVIKYIFQGKFTQNQVNEYLAGNRFNFLDLYFNFRSIIITGILTSFISPLISFYYLILAYIGWVLALHALNNSEFNTYDDLGINTNIKNRYFNIINYYGFFFKKFIGFEIINIINMAYVLILGARINFFLFTGIYCGLAEIIGSYQTIKFFRSHLHTSKLYSETKFTKTFKDNKWIDIQKLLKDLNHEKGN